MINKWVTNCSLKISRADYVQAIQVRSNKLKTQARAARERKENGINLCRLDRQATNSNHIFKVCQATHGLRVKRHDEVVDMLKSSKKSGKVKILNPILYGEEVLLEEARVLLEHPSIRIKETIVHGVPMTFKGSLDNFTCWFLKRLGVPRRF